VKGVRFPNPRCLPSPGASQLPPVPKHERTAELSSKYGAHVMRIAVPRTNRPPFASCGPNTCVHGVSPLVARLPSTRLLSRTSFRLDRYRGRASLSPKTTYRLLQYDDARAPAAGRRILDRGVRQQLPRRALHTYVRCLLPLARSRERRATRRFGHPKMHAARGPADPSEGSRVFRRREAPPRTDRAPLCRACVRVKRTVVPLPHFTTAPSDPPRERDAPRRQQAGRPPVLHPPAKDGCSRRRPRCVPPLRHPPIREDCSSLFDDVGSPATRHRLTRRLRRFAARVPAPV